MSYQQVMSLHAPTPIHRLKLIASFALLGAVILGSFSVFPLRALPAVEHLDSIGALLGGAAGIAVQLFRR